MGFSRLQIQSHNISGRNPDLLLGARWLHTILLRAGCQLEAQRSEHHRGRSWATDLATMRQATTEGVSRTYQWFSFHHYSYDCGRSIRISKSSTPLFPRCTITMTSSKHHMSSAMSGHIPLPRPHPHETLRGYICLSNPIGPSQGVARSVVFQPFDPRTYEVALRRHPTSALRRHVPLACKFVRRPCGGAG